MRRRRKPTSVESEFDGEVRRNGVLAKDPGMPLKAWERLRLLYRTGQKDDPTVEPDHRIWDGWAPSPNSVIDFED